MPAAPASSTLLRTAFFASAILLTAFSAEAIAQTSACVEGTVTDYVGVPIPETTVRLAPPDPLRQVPEVVTTTRDASRSTIWSQEPTKLMRRTRPWVTCAQIRPCFIPVYPLFRCPPVLV